VSIRKAPLAMQFEGGVDTRTEAKQVPTTKLLDLQNCVFTKQTTLSKRNGYRVLSTQIQNAGGSITGARGLGERDGEILLFTDKRCYSQRPSADRWADTGEVAATTASTLPIARTGTYQTQPDYAVRNGVAVVAWEDSRGGVWLSVIEEATGRILQSQTQIDSSANAKNPRCIACGDVLHVLWTREDLGQIKIAIVNPVTPATAPVVSIFTADLDGTKPFYDAEAAIAAPTGIVQRPGIIAWVRNGGGFRVAYIHPSGVIGSGVTGLPSATTFVDVVTGPMAISFNASDAQIAIGWIAVAGGTTIRVRFVNSSALGSSAFYDPVSVSAGYSRITLAWGAALPSGFAGLYWAAEVTAARSDLTAVESGLLDLGSVTPGAVTRLKGHGLVSRAWHDGAGTSVGLGTPDGDAYVMVAHTVRFNPYIAALRLSDSSGINSPGNTIVARLMPGDCSGSLMRVTGAGTRAWTQHLPSVQPLNMATTDIFSRQHAVILPYRIQLSSQFGDQFSEQGLKLCILDFDVQYQTAQLGRGLYLASAAPKHYDGDAWHEADFNAGPDLGFDATGAAIAMAATNTPVPGGAGVIPAGTYLYAYWYEAVDAQGELHRSGVSTKMVGTIGALGKFNLGIPTCRLTNFSNVRLCAARSIQGATGADSQLALYRITSNDVTVTTGDNRYVNNDVTADSIVLSDNLTDAQLLTREPLYTNGGILSNDPAPWGGKMLAVAKNRLFFDSSSDPLQVCFTQQRADDTAMEAPVGLAVQVDPIGGPVTAIGVMDDVILPFKSGSIYAFGGPGPLANPSAAPESNAFTLPERVTGDVGCTSQMSICDSPAGITFQSAKGIMLLNRGRQLVNIGNPVEAYDSQTITRATLSTTVQRIIYLTDAGRSLLWDYNRDQWSTFTNHTGLDAVTVDGTYYYLRTDSRVFAETPGLYLDDNSQIPMVIETAWIHFAPYLQGWQKILWAYFLGSFKSAHTLSVRFRLDYNDAYSSAILNNVNANWNPSVYGGGSYGVGSYGGTGLDGTRYQRRIHLNKRCQAISFLIQDIEATGDGGASFELSELLLIGGGLGPDFKVGPSRSA